MPNGRNEKAFLLRIPPFVSDIERSGNNISRSAVVTDASDKGLWIHYIPEQPSFLPINSARRPDSAAGFENPFGDSLLA